MGDIPEGLGKAGRQRAVCVDMLILYHLPVGGTVCSSGENASFPVPTPVYAFALGAGSK